MNLRNKNNELLWFGGSNDKTHLFLFYWFVVLITFCYFYLQQILLLNDAEKLIDWWSINFNCIVLSDKSPSHIERLNFLIGKLTNPYLRRLQNHLVHQNKLSALFYFLSFNNFLVITASDGTSTDCWVGIDFLYIHTSS